MKTFGFEPKTFPLKEGHSTYRVLLSANEFYDFGNILNVSSN